MSKRHVDTWSTNPYPPDHPKHMEYDAETKREQRIQLVNRFRGGKRTNLRLMDYAREFVNYEKKNLGARSSSPRHETMQAVSKNVPAPQPQKPQQRSEMKVALEGATSCVTMHGGATLWVAHSDGTIGVRNGFTGELTHTIPSLHSECEEDNETEHSAEECPAGSYQKLLLFGRYVMGIHSAGRVHILDTITMQCVGNEGGVLGTAAFEVDPKENDSVLTAQPVAATQASFFTVSTQGIVTVWDIEEGIEEEGIQPSVTLTKCEDLGLDVASAAAYEGHLYLGTTDGHIAKIDMDDLGLVNDFTVSEDDQAATAVALAQGLLFVGTRGGRILILDDIEKPTMNLIAEHTTYHDEKTEVTHIIPDHRSNTVWSVSTDGDCTCWFMCREKKFAIKERFVVGEGRVLSADFYCHADSMRLWTLATNGVNFVWLTEFARSVCDMNDAIGDMEEVIEKESQAVEEWERRIQKKQDENTRRKNLCIGNLVRLCDSGLRRVFFGKLLRWRITQQSTKRRLQMAEIMCSTTDAGLMRLYYVRLLRNFQINKYHKQKLAIVGNMLCCTDKGMQRVYFRKFHQFYLERRRERQKKLFGGLILRNSDNGLRQCYYRMWQLVVDKLKYRRKRHELAQSMLRGSDRGLQQLYFFKLQRSAKLKKEAKKREELTNILRRSSDEGILSIYYRRLKENISNQKRRRTRELWCNTMVETTDSGVRSHYFSRWNMFIDKVKQDRAERQIFDREEKIANLSAAQDAMRERLDKTEKLKQMRERLKALKEESDTLSKRQGELLDNNLELKKKIEDKKKRDEVDASLRDELTATMRRLKSRAINVSSDVAFITKTLDKCKTGAAKVFLAAHMDVKRHIVQIVGEGEDPLKWPLGATEVQVKRRVARFPAHTQPAIVSAIKTMVITFDVLTQKDLDNLGTDEEIVANADDLISMYDTLSTLLAKRKPSAANK